MPILRSPDPFVPRVRDRGFVVPHVVIAIQGGLGNQLFQYSLGRGLAQRGFDVQFETLRLADDRPFELARLIPDQRVLRHDPLRDEDGSRSAWTLFRQRGFEFDEAMLEELTDQTVLLGYWTSQRYWFGADHVIRGSVTRVAQQSLTRHGRRLARALRRSSDQWSVHIRRGDYVANPKASAHHGNLDAAYYDRALHQARSLGARRFAIFSDDLEWVEANLAQPGDLLVDRSVSTGPAGELFLMAQCAGRVLANSTFSWWGAALADRGPTVAPSQWFAGVDRDHSDFVPADWIRIPTFADTP